MKTSAKVLILGLYASECCSIETIFDKGDTFTRCPNCEHLCKWDLVETVYTPEDIEEYQEAA